MRRFVTRLLLLALVAGCDASYGQFLDAVPEPDREEGRPVHVLLGIDGLSRAAFDEARARGAFAKMQVGDLIPPFPGTSDYVWTRTLRAGSLGGYEIQYFDPEANRLRGAGLPGVAEHPFREGIVGSFPAYRRFDFLGDGELWQLDSYVDPEAALPTTLDQMFDTLATRARGRDLLLAYLLNVDVLAHSAPRERVVAMLVEIDRRIQAFERTQKRPFRFTLFADHGNAHQKARLVDAREILRAVGVAPVERLGADGALEAVPVVHVRVNYLALHARPERVAEIAARSSRHPDLDLVAARLPDVVGADGARQRFGIWRRGEPFFFERTSDGKIRVEDPARWGWLGAELPREAAERGPGVWLEDRAALALTAAGPYPDLFYRVATAFTNPAAQHPADLLWSFPDDVASFGFHVPGAADSDADAGFHGGLARASSLSVLASEAFVPAPVTRTDDLADLFPLLRGER